MSWCDAGSFVCDVGEDSKEVARSNGVFPEGQYLVWIRRPIT